MTFVNKYFRFHHLIFISTFYFKPFCGTRALAPAKKQHCVRCCKEFCQQAPKDPNFSWRIIIGNQSCIFRWHLIISCLEASIDFHPIESTLNKSAKTEASAESPAARPTPTKTPLTVHASILTNHLITFLQQELSSNLQPKLAINPRSGCAVDLTQCRSGKVHSICQLFILTPNP